MERLLIIWQVILVQKSTCQWIFPQQNPNSLFTYPQNINYEPNQMYYHPGGNFQQLPSEPIQNQYRQLQTPTQSPSAQQNQAPFQSGPQNSQFPFWPGSPFQFGQPQQPQSQESQPSTQFSSYRPSQGYFPQNPQNQQPSQQPTTQISSYQPSQGYFPQNPQNQQPAPWQQQPSFSTPQQPYRSNCANPFFPCPAQNNPFNNYNTIHESNSPNWGPSIPTSTLTTTTSSPNRNNSGISALKCDEYKKLSYETASVGGLVLNPTVSIIKSEKCDISTGLIYGGRRSNDGEFTHMAAIGYPDAIEDSFGFGCGGSLISERFVLTAAHCKFKGRIRASLVRLGSLKIKSFDEDFTIADFIGHEKYNQITKVNDIAVIKLSKDVSMKNPKKIRPACLWQNDIIDSQTAIATGWGRTEQEASSKVLLKVQLDIFDIGKCRDYYEDTNVVINGNHICAGVLAGGHDTCQGDSGGPLQIALPDNKCTSYIIGVTSHGIGCGYKNSSSLYTKVSSYIDWIESKVWA